MMPADEFEFRLPTTVVPTHYAVAIRTDLVPTSSPSQSRPSKFYGEAVIDLDVTGDVSELEFNLHPSLQLSSIALTVGSGEAAVYTLLPVDGIVVDDEQERAKISLESVVPGGKILAGSSNVQVYFKWSAELKAGMNGYYVSEGDVDSVTGKRVSYAMTQFQATAARKAFPCWDEPLIKSRFTITMISPETDTVLSNMPAVSSLPWSPSNLPKASISTVFSSTYSIGSSLTVTASEDEEEEEEEQTGIVWTRTTFETSPFMSTYLVAFASGPFVHLDAEHESVLTGKSVPLRIYATENLIGQAQFGLDIMKWALPVYEEIFDIPYALPKLDTLVAHDFAAGAMENWGLITGRTTAYLYDPDKSPLSAQKRVAIVQCHELAHMWFGNIVTMKWWDNLWLNEAFATLMGELVLCDRLWPEWNMRSEFLNTHWTNALALDSQRSSHPIEVDCPDANKIGQIFDGISYSKGASILRMLSAVVGERDFLRGVSLYLKKHVYGNAVTADLWEGISEATGVNVGEIMSSWVLKIGYPVLSVHEVGDGTIRVTQNRFLSTGDVKPEEDETIWYVPLELKTVRCSSSGFESSVNHEAVLSDRAGIFSLDGAETFKLNAETVGVYRVVYSPERLAALATVAYDSFSIADRVGLLSDAATLSQAGYTRTSAALSFILELGKKETEHLPWAQIDKALTKLSSTWWEQPVSVRASIQAVRRKLFNPIVDRLGYEHGPDDGPDVKQLRELAVGNSASAEDPSVLAQLRARFQPFLVSGDDSKIPADLQRIIYVNAVRHGGSAEYEKMLEVYRHPPNPSTKVDAMYALCAPTRTEILDDTFGMLRDATAIKDQDLFIFYVGLNDNVAARRKLSDYFLAEYDSISTRFDNDHGMNYLVKNALQLLSTEKDLDRVKAFFEDKDIRKFKLSVLQTFDSIHASAKWLAKDAEDVEQWLKEQALGL